MNSETAQLRHGVIAAVTAYLLAYLVYAVAEQQALFADGAAVLLRAVGAQSVSSLDTNRIVADALFQWPVLAASRLGVTDLETLSYLLGVGYHYLVVVSLPIAWCLLPRERKALMLFPILSLLFGWMGSSFLAIHQANALALWFWPVFFAVLFRPAERGRDVLILIILALPMVGLYDTIVVLGPLLAAVAGWRWLREPAARHRWLWAALVLWFIVAAAISVGYILFPRSAGNRANFIWSLSNGAFLVGADGVNWPLALALLGAPLLALAAWRPAWLSASRWVWLPPFLLCALFVAFAPLVSLSTFSPVLQFYARAFAGFLPAGLAVLLLIGEARGWRPSEATRSSLLLVLSLIAVAQITWHIVATAQWAGYLTIFRATLAERPGLIAFESTPMAQPRIGRQVLLRLNWGWTNPWLSVVLAPGGRVSAIIANPGGRSAGTVDPTRATGLPPIAGVDYSSYVAALQGAAAN
jgi:hypothetical protein